MFDPAGWLIVVILLALCRFYALTYYAGCPRRFPWPCEQRRAPYRVATDTSRKTATRALLTDRILLLRKDGDTFDVLGEGDKTAASIYTVAIGPFPTCECKAFKYRKDGSPCKHILHIFLNYYGVPANHYMAHQQALLSWELDYIQQRSRDVAWATRTFVDRVFGGTAAPRNTDCSVCFEELNDSTGTCASCNNSFHASCVEQYNAARRQQGLPPTCAMCRRPWSAVAPIVKDEDGLLIVAHPHGPKVRLKKVIH